MTSTSAPLPQHIVALAVPALLTLLAEPLFLLADTAIVGHLGTVPLAGLGVASTALLTCQGLFVFLAYGTTAAVARRFGAGERQDALEVGVAGMWLAMILGIGVAVVVAFFAEQIVALFGASGPATQQAAQYLQISAIGLPAMLISLAATGVFRGLQDTRTPLVVAIAGFSSNIVLNLGFVYGLGWGIAGSATGTVLSQWAMAVALTAIMVRSATRYGVGLHAHPGRVLAAARDGLPLLVRTLALRIVIILQTWAAAGLGDIPLAAHQVVSTLWGFLALALDALAIAAQALTGAALGAHDTTRVRSLTATMVRWGVLGGSLLGLGVLLVHRALPLLFTTDRNTIDALAAGLIVVAIMQPICGWAFVLDGILIGAGDARWLAGAMVATLIISAPVLITAKYAAANLSAPWAVVTLWSAFGIFMIIRTGTLIWRERSDAWQVLGF